MYDLFYLLMIIGYLGVSIQTPSLKMKIVGILLTIINAIIFWR